MLPLLAVGALLFVREAPPHPGTWLAEAGLEPRVLEVAGVGVRCVRAGSGSPVLLVHGFGSSLYTWKDVIPSLRESHDVIALDLPGFGGSSRPRQVSLDLYVQTVLGLMDALRLERASCVGSSLGGAVCALVAARHPERLERLALVDAAGFNWRPADWPLAIRLIGSPLAPLLERLPLRRALVRLALREVFYDDSRVTDDRVEEYLAPIARPGSVGALHALTSALRSPEASRFPQLLEQVRARTLVLWGREDRWIPVEQADRFVQTIPGARKIVLESCGHLPQEERPQEVSVILSQFLGPS